MLGVRHIYVGDNIHDAAVRLLREALVLAAVAGFHVENRNMQAFCADNTQAAIRVTQNQNSIRLNSDHQLVALRDDVAHSLAKVCADSVHVHLRVCQL